MGNEAGCQRCCSEDAELDLKDPASSGFSSYLRASSSSTRPRADITASSGDEELENEHQVLESRSSDPRRLYLETRSSKAPTETPLPSPEHDRISAAMSHDEPASEPQKSALTLPGVQQRPQPSPAEADPTIGLSTDLPATLPITFIDCGGQTQTVTFRETPLGINFTGILPVFVKSVDLYSEGEELGVKSGWALKAIGDIDAGDLDYGSAMNVLNRSIKGLPKSE